VPSTPDSRAHDESVGRLESTSARRKLVDDMKQRSLLLRVAVLTGAIALVVALVVYRSITAGSNALHASETSTVVVPAADVQTDTGTTTPTDQKRTAEEIARLRDAIDRDHFTGSKSAAPLRPSDVPNDFEHFGSSKRGEAVRPADLPSGGSKESAPRPKDPPSPPAK